MRATTCRSPSRRPIYVLLCSATAPQCDELRERVVKLLARYGDSVGLVTVDVDAEPGLAEAFQLQAVPAMLALMAGRPVPLFQGTPDDQQLSDVFAQVAEVALQAGMEVQDSGAEHTAEDGGEAEDKPLPPLHQEAFDAIEREDYEAAVAAYDQALKENPKDADARAGRAQVSLIARSADGGRCRRCARPPPTLLTTSTRRWQSPTSTCSAAWSTTRSTGSSTWWRPPRAPTGTQCVRD